jgi:orotidine-5'-phosphate decarboxylase
VGFVVGLTNADPDILPLLPDAPLLVPGLGAQGGDLAALRGSGRRAPALVNVSRGILYPSDGSTPGEAAAEWRAQIAAALGR